MKIKLYNDVAFKWIFGRQEHTGPLIQLINAVICHEEGSPRFSDVSIMNPYDTSEPLKNEKQGILDIRARDNLTGEWVDLEVQVRYKETYPQRSKYYLAGLYRDQLEKSQTDNYDELKPVFGIHILVESLFREKADETFWFNHYMILNTRSHQPLVEHWHLYYVELKKLLKQLSAKGVEPATDLETWGYFLGTIHDNSKPPDSTLYRNQGIREVYDMLQTFTQDDHLREKYRLQEEFERALRTDEARKQKLMRDLQEERRAKEAAVREKEAALKAAKNARNAEKNARNAEKDAQKVAIDARNAEKAASKAAKDALQEAEQVKRHTVRILRQQGLSTEEVASLLNISLDEIERIQAIEG